MGFIENLLLWNMHGGGEPVVTLLRFATDLFAVILLKSIPSMYTLSHSPSIYGIIQWFQIKP